MGIGDLPGPDCVSCSPDSYEVITCDGVVPRTPRPTSCWCGVRDHAGQFQPVELDCLGTVGGWRTVDDYEGTRVDLMTGDYQDVGACSTGRHVISSEAPFGLWIWGRGTAATTELTQSRSYGCPGGMNVRPIHDVVIDPEGWAARLDRLQGIYRSVSSTSRVSGYGEHSLAGFPVVLKRAVVLVGLTGLGVGVYLWLVRDPDSSRARRRREGGQPVRVIEVAARSAVPSVTGYGVVAAQRSWQGVTQVSGRVVEVDERVQVGRIVREGDVLFRIDPEDLELEKSKSESSVKGVKAQLAEMRAREKGNRASLEVERKVLALARKELERTRELHASGAASLAEIETAEREVLTAEKSVVSLENTLAELPASRRVLEAQLEQLEAGVTGADLQLARTEVVAPFTMRIRQVDATIGQAVSSGAVLVIGDGVDAVEITAKLPVGAIDPLLPARTEPRAETMTGGEAAGDPAAGGEPSAAGAAASEARDPAAELGDATAELGDPTADPSAATSPRARGGRLARIAEAIDATVILDTPTVQGRWPARFSHFAGIDETSRTLGVVVTVDEPRRREGQRSVRLSPGMHVEVDLRGEPQAGCLALPIEAVHGTTVYVVDAEDRVELRSVELSWAQEEFVCVGEGLVAGERVVTSSLTPAVAGMLLEPTVDEFEAQRLETLVDGEQPEP